MMENGGRPNHMPEPADTHPPESLEDGGGATSEHLLCADGQVAGVCDAPGDPGQEEEEEEAAGVTLEPPDGGYGWVIVFSAIMCGWIISTNFTGFSMLYVAFTEYFDADKGVTGWIGSCHIATGNFLGLIFSVLIKHKGCRFVTILGALIAAFGFVLSSFANGILYLFLTFGLIAGIGSGMIFLSSVVIVQQYFTTKRAMAAGIASSGLSMGTLTGSLSVQFLIDTLGWRGAMLLNAGFYLHVCIFGALLRPVSQYSKVKAKPRIYNPPKPVKAIRNGTEDNLTPSSEPSVRKESSRWRREWRDVCDFSALRNPQFLLFCLGNMFCAFGFLTFYQHTPGLARFYGIEMQRVAFLPTITGLVTFLSRITFGFVANLKCVNTLVQYAVATFLGGILEMLYVFATDYSHFVIFCVFMGCINGAFFTVTTTVVVDLLTVKNAAKGQAISSLFMGAGFLLGVPFAGWLFDISGGYELSFYVTGGVQALGGLIVLALPLWRKIKGTEKNPKSTYDATQEKCTVDV